MLFRIEDNENFYGCHRVYTIPYENLPVMRLSELQDCIAAEIRKEVNNAFQDSRKADHESLFYDPILQLQDIQNDSFEDSYMLSDYNGNIISDWIWKFYSEYLYIMGRENDNS